ncbi:MAG: hypothetical protein QOE80_3884 [Actinomycetota bacterium]|nr:hypothetical protein [Actinomycetota bacterium]
MLQLGLIPPHWTAPGCLAGLGVAALAGVTVAIGLTGFVRANRWLVGVVSAALVFQAVHFAEHAVQAGYWLIHRQAAPYLTPWAASTRTGLAYWCRVWGGEGAPLAQGNELLHLVGNTIFLGGLLGMLALARRVGDPSAWRSARQVAVLQGLHVVEHVALTTTLFLTGAARGLSTLFGTIPPTSAGAVAYRISFHFAINLLATILAVRAARRLRAAGAFDIREARKVRDPTTGRLPLRAA